MFNSLYINCCLLLCPFLAALSPSSPRTIRKNSTTDCRLCTRIAGPAPSRQTWSTAASVVVIFCIAHGVKHQRAETHNKKIFRKYHLPFSKRLQIFHRQSQILLVKAVSSEDDSAQKYFVYTVNHNLLRDIFIIFFYSVAILKLSWAPSPDYLCFIYVRKSSGEAEAEIRLLVTTVLCFFLWSQNTAQHDSSQIYSTLPSLCAYLCKSISSLIYAFHNSYYK